MKNQFNALKNGISLLMMTLVLGSCAYQNVGEAVFPDTLTYLPASVGGVYNVNTVAATGAVRYSVDLTNKKLNIPLGIFRSGTTFDGNFTANIAANNDTINKMIAATRLTATDLLSAENYSLPTSVTGESGKDAAPFNLSVNLDYLRNNAAKKFAVAVTISGDKINQGLSTAVVVIDAKILKPVANFTTAVAGKKVTFTNTSTFGTSYSWNFGDGSAASTTAAPVYTYATAGTFTVTLTTTGITGTLDATTKTMTVTVL